MTRSLRATWRAALAAALGIAIPAAAQLTTTTGTLVVLNKSASSAALLDAASGATLATIPTGDGPHEVAVSPDGRWAVVSNYGGQPPGSSLTVLDLGRRAAVRTIDLEPHRGPHGLAWIAGSEVAVTTERDSSVLVVDVTAGQVTRRFVTGQRTTHMVVPSPDGRVLYAANIGSGSVTRIERATGAVRSAPSGRGSEGIALTPDGRELWVVNREADSVTVLDAATLERRGAVPSAGFPIRVKISPDGRLALVSNARGSSIAVLDVARRAPLATIALPVDSAAVRGTILGQAFGASAVPIGITFAPDGRTAYVALANTDAIAVIDVARRAVTRYFTTGREPDGIAFVK